MTARPGSGGAGTRDEGPGRRRRRPRGPGGPPADGPSEKERAREAALQLLTVRARSTGELRDRLLRKRFSEDVVERIVSDLTEARLLDDGDFARLWADERVRLRPVGRRRLVAELRARKVDPAVIDEVAAEVYEEHPEVDLARRALRKRLRGAAPDPDERKRLEGFLLRRGFSYGTVASVLNDPDTED